VTCGPATRCRDGPPSRRRGGTWREEREGWREGVFTQAASRCLKLRKRAAGKLKGGTIAALRGSSPPSAFSRSFPLLLLLPAFLLYATLLPIPPPPFRPGSSPSPSHFNGRVCQDRHHLPYLLRGAAVCARRPPQQFLVPFQGKRALSHLFLIGGQVVPTLELKLVQ
jgi:hypothetical protein